MTERNPLPDCLSHLAQRDRAIRIQALAEACATVCEWCAAGLPFDAAMGENFAGHRTPYGHVVSCYALEIRDLMRDAP